MHILWKYLHPQRWLVLLSLVLAATAQVLSLIDPIIFGKIIDDYAGQINLRPRNELIKGVLWWLAIAVGVALLARVAKAFQDYTTRLAVQKFGMQILMTASAKPSAFPSMNTKNSAVGRPWPSSRKYAPTPKGLSPLLLIFCSPPW